MRTLWNLLSFLAVVNLLALGMLAVWLWKTDRLDRERLQQTRALFAPTLTEVREAAEEAEEARGDAAGPAADQGVSGPALIGQLSRLREQEALALRRLREEQKLLAVELERRGEALRLREVELEKQRDELLASTQVDRRQKADEQFAKSVRQLESVPAKQGKQMLMALIAQDEMAQAVTYLDAMQPRAATRILREFKTEQESRMATELLEQLRRFGVGADRPEISSHDQRTSPDAQPARSEARPGPARAEPGETR